MKVPIKTNHLQGQPFALKSRLGIAFVLAFYGDREEVSEFMQKASHRTRSYYINANGLKGFIAAFSIINDVIKADSNGDLEEVTKYQKVDVQAVVKKLRCIKTNK